MDTPNNATKINGQFTLRSNTNGNYAILFTLSETATQEDCDTTAYFLKHLFDAGVINLGRVLQDGVPQITVNKQFKTCYEVGFQT